MKQGLLKKLLGSGSYTVVNKHLAKKIGVVETYLFQYMLDLQDNLFSGNEFYQQQSRISEDTGLSEKVIRSTISELVRLELISVTRKGIPAKLYYHIDDDKTSNVVMNLLVDTNSNGKNEQSVITNSDDMELQDVTKGNILQEQNVTTNTRSNNTKSKDTKIDNTKSKDTKINNTSDLEFLNKYFNTEDLVAMFPNNKFDYSEDTELLLIHCREYIPVLTQYLDDKDLLLQEYYNKKFTNLVSQIKSNRNIKKQN